MLIPLWASLLILAWNSQDVVKPLGPVLILLEVNGVLILTTKFRTSGNSTTLVRIPRATTPQIPYYTKAIHPFLGSHKPITIPAWIPYVLGSQQPSSNFFWGPQAPIESWDPYPGTLGALAISTMPHRRPPADPLNEISFRDLIKEFLKQSFQ